MLRKTLFYLFVLIYLISCPIIILDSLGITIRPGRHKLMMATGLISVATIPEGALIYINDELYPQKSPAIIRDLSPGTYKIKMTLPDHQVWQKNIVIEQEQVTALENVLLVPLKWEKEILNDQHFKQLIATEDNPFFLLQRGANIDDLFVYRYKDDLLQHVALTNLTPEQKIASVKTMPQSPFLLLQMEGNNAPSYLWLDIKSTPPKLENLSVLINQPEKIFWNKDDERSLFYSTPQGLNRINLDEKSLDANFINNLKGYDLFNGQLYLIDNEKHLSRMDYLHKTETISLTGLLTQLPSEFPSETEYALHLFSENLIVFLCDSGKLLSNKLPYTIAEKDVVGFSKELNDKQMIFWTKEKLGVIDFTKVKSEGVLEIGPSIRWLVNNGKNIRQAFWVNGGSYILYNDNNHIKMVEATDVQKPFISDIVETSDDIVYSDKLGKLFYLDPKSHQLTSLTILHAREFITFKLPSNFRKKEIK